MFVGVRLCEGEKYEGGPNCEFSPPKEEKTLVGFVLDCELLREGDVVSAAASGDILEVASGREFRSSMEAVLAASRVRDAIAGVVLWEW